jgi:hypothetical protein
VSFQAMAWAVDQKTGSAAAKLILLMLANRADETTGECYPKISRIAQEAEVSIRTVKQHLVTLRTLGLVEWEHQARADGSRSSNLYRLRLGSVQTARGASPQSADSARGGAESAESDIAGTRVQNLHGVVRDLHPQEEPVIRTKESKSKSKSTALAHAPKNAARGPATGSGPSAHLDDPDDTAQPDPTPPPAAHPTHPCTDPHCPCATTPDAEPTTDAAPPTAAPPTAAAAPTNRTRGTRLPHDWQPSPALTAWTTTHIPGLDLTHELDKFRDHWAAQPGQRGVKIDWDATWRNWARNAHTWTRGPHRGNGRPSGSTTHERVAAGLALVQKFAALDYPQPPQQPLLEIEP